MGIFGPGKREVEALARQYIQVSLDDDDRARLPVRRHRGRASVDAAHMSSTTQRHNGHTIEVVSVWGSPHWRLLVDGTERANGAGAGGFGLPGLSGVRMSAELDGAPLDAFVRNMGVGYRLELKVAGEQILKRHFI